MLSSCASLNLGDVSLSGFRSYAHCHGLTKAILFGSPVWGAAYSLVCAAWCSKTWSIWLVGNHMDSLALESMWLPIQIAAHERTLSSILTSPGSLSLCPYEGCFVPSLVSAVYLSSELLIILLLLLTFFRPHSLTLLSSFSLLCACVFARVRAWHASTHGRGATDIRIASLTQPRFYCLQQDRPFLFVQSLFLVVRKLLTAIMYSARLYKRESSSNSYVLDVA